jgi:hypothetical protein
VRLEVANRMVQIYLVDLLYEHQEMVDRIREDKSSIYLEVMFRDQAYMSKKYT